MAGDINSMNLLVQDDDTIRVVTTNVIYSYYDGRRINGNLSTFGPVLENMVLNLKHAYIATQ